MEIIQPPERSGEGVAHIFGAAVVEIVRLLQPVRQSVGQRLAGERLIELLIVVEPGGRQHLVARGDDVRGLVAGATGIIMLGNKDDAPRAPEVVDKIARPSGLAWGGARPAESCLWRRGGDSLHIFLPRFAIRRVLLRKNIRFIADGKAGQQRLVMLHDVLRQFCGVLGLAVSHA